MADIDYNRRWYLANKAYANEKNSGILCRNCNAAEGHLRRAVLLGRCPPFAAYLANPPSQRRFK